MVLVAMLISCRCSSVSVWKRRMEEPEEKAIQTPLPAFTMCVTLTASSWCASKLCCSTDRGVSVLGRACRPSLWGAQADLASTWTRVRAAREPQKPSSGVSVSV